MPPQRTARSPGPSLALTLALGLGALVGARPAAAQEAPATEPVKLLQIGVCVSDLERSVKFYTEALGFKLEGKPVPIPKTLNKLLEQPAVLRIDEVVAPPQPKLTRVRCWALATTAVYPLVLPPGEEP